MRNFEWDRLDVYRSNEGAGPLKARILCVGDGYVHMERWKRSQESAVRFSLPIKFFLSDRCGWKRAID